MESLAFSELKISEWWTRFKKENTEWIHGERNGPLVLFVALLAGNAKMGNLRMRNTLTPTALETALKEFNMSGLVAYIWREGGKEIGHASLQLTDGTYISWFPSYRSEKRCKAVQNATFEQDVKNLRNVQVVAYKMEPETFSERRIDEWWRLFQKENTEWIHLERNGPLVVFEALYAGNAKMEILKKHMVRHGVLNTLTPTGLETALKEFNMSGLVAYIWREKGNAIGHASLQLTDGTYISWFPSKPLEETCLAAKNVTFETDVKNLRNVQVVAYKMEPGPETFSERRINEWWRLFQKENKDWIHLERNGPLVVFEALYAGNIKMEKLKMYMGRKGELNTLTAIGLETALKEFLAHGCH